MRKELRRPLVLTCLILAGIILPFLFWGDFFERLFSIEATRALLEAHRSTAWLIGIGLLMSDLVLPIPGTVIMSALGWLYGPLLGGVAASAGSLLSALIAYALSRTIGRRMAVWIAGEENLSAAADWFATRGGAVIALSRCLPVLNEAIACLAGLSNFPLPQFCAAATLGALPVGFAFAAIGHLGKDDTTAATLLSAILPLLLWFLYRRLKGKQDPSSERSGR
jgi:uncharacterized membrane protein YdjX (TVP38/TMEM64 family)